MSKRMDRVDGKISEIEVKLKDQVSTSHATKASRKKSVPTEVRVSEFVSLGIKLVLIYFV